MVLSLDQINELLENIRLRVLVANRDGSLLEILKKSGWDDLLSQKEEEVFLRTGYIYVLGYSDVKESHLIAAAKELGIDKERFIMVLDYNKLERFPYEKLRYEGKCAAILVGAMAHKTCATGGFSSAIAMMEAPQSGYPPVFRLNANSALKITKSDFVRKLQELIRDGIISL